MKNNTVTATKFVRLLGGGLLILLGLVVATFFLKPSLWEDLKKQFLLFPKEILLIAFSAGVVQIFLMMVRFLLLSLSVKEERVFRSFYGVSVGQLMNLFLPARIGDFFKVVVISGSREKFSIKNIDLNKYGKGTGILLSDKLIDTIGLVLLIGITGAYQKVSLTRYLPYAAALMLCYFGWKLFFSKKQSVKNNKPSFFQKISEGFSAVQDKRILVTSILVSSLVWLSESTALKFLCEGQGFVLGWGDVVFCLVVLNLAISVPITVANVGPFEAALTGALATYQIPTEKGLAISAAHHLLHILANSFWAILFLIENYRRKRYKPQV